MRYITEAQVREALPMADCLGMMRTVFMRLASGEALNHPRRRLVLPTRSTLHYMAGSDGRYFGAKIYATNPKHGAHFLFLLYRAEDAAPLAIIEANALGQIRTGAASGLATSLLANPGARTLALIGSGFQARTQLEAMLAAVPSIERVRTWSRSAEKREAFAREMTAQFGKPVETALTAEAAVRSAEILVTATNSAEPVIDSAWIGPGVHINAMGSNQARRRELPTDLVRRAGLIAVDSLEQSRMESGDLLLAFEDRDWERVVELQSVVAGRARRLSPEQLTIFKSNGLAVEDVISAGLVYERTC